MARCAIYILPMEELMALAKDAGDAHLDDRGMSEVSACGAMPVIRASPIWVEI